MYLPPLRWTTISKEKSVPGFSCRENPPAAHIRCASRTTTAAGTSPGGEMPSPPLSSHPESAWRRHWYLGVFDTGRPPPVANPREEPKSPAPSSHAMAALSFCRPPEICGRPRPFEIPLQNRRKPFMVWSKALKVKAQYNLNVPRSFCVFRLPTVPQIHIVVKVVLVLQAEGHRFEPDTAHH